jgi:hypothetical protein
MEKEKAPQETVVPTELQIATQPTVLRMMLKKLKDNPQIKDSITIREEDLKKITFFVKEE